MPDDNYRGQSNDARVPPERTSSGPDVMEGELIDVPVTAARRRKLRGGLLLGVGCVTSPCCTPLIVPLGLTLLAGTPLAAFLSQYVGWVYGGLTLASAVSLFFGVRHLWQGSSSQEESALTTRTPASREDARGMPLEMEA